MENVALITGASSGIGLELARIHAERGGDLVIIARSEDKLEDLKAELEKNYSVNVMVISKDLSKPTAPQEIFDEVKNAGIKLDILINNAGFGGRGKFHEMKWEWHQNMINVNIIALTALTYLFLPGFVERKRGKILNVSSTASLMPGPLQAVYFATKAYVSFLSNALAEELKGTGVTVTALLPGATDTGFEATSGMDKTDMFKKPASARKVAIDGYHAMLKGKLEVVTGVSFAMRAMLDVVPVVPKKILLKTIHKMQEVN